MKKRIENKMRKFIDMTGQKFGKLTVIKKDEKEHRAKNGKKHIYWICQCDCGTVVPIKGEYLRSTETTRCKICRYKSAQLNGHISYRKVKIIKDNAKKRNIYYDKNIDKKYLWSLYLKQNKKCALSGIDIKFADTHKEETCKKGTTASLDRINNSKEYTKDNIQWVHKDINKMKYTYNSEQFISTCQDIVKNNNKKNLYDLNAKNENGQIFSHKLWYSMKKGARDRNILFSKKITKQLLWELYLKQNKKCILTGWGIVLAKSGKYQKYNTASLDRIDSSKNYTLNNIQWLHKDINRMKWGYSQNYFMNISKLVVNYNE